MPIKEYVDIGVFLAILIGIGWFAHYERVEGEQKVVAAQQAADLKQAAIVAKVNADAAASVDGLQTRLSAALAASAQPSVVVRMCINSPVPPHASAAGEGPAAGSDGSSGPSGGVGGADIAPGTEAILARDKAMIDSLQGYVRICQNAGLCAK